MKRDHELEVANRIETCPVDRQFAVFDTHLRKRAPDPRVGCRCTSDHVVSAHGHGTQQWCPEPYKRLRQAGDHQDLATWLTATKSGGSLN